MATDQFGNELTEEELYRLMLQQQQLGLRPGPVDTFANIPATPPAINYSRVMEDWSDPGILSAPAFNAPRPATTADVTPVDPTLAGMGDLAMTRHERRGLQLPIGPFTPLPDFNVPAFTPLGPTQQVPARIRQTIPTANDPTGGLSATDPSLQGVTPTSMAQVNGGVSGDYSQVLADAGIEPTTAGMSTVQPLSAGLDTTYIGTPYEDPLQHLDLAYGVKSQPSTTGSWLEQQQRQFVKSLPDFARLAASAHHDDAAKIDAKARQIGMSDLSEDEKQDAISGLRQDIQDVMNNIVMEDAYQSNIPFDQMKQSIVTGVNPLIVIDENLTGTTTTAPTRSNLQAMAELMSTGDASLEDSAMEMAFQQDTFKELSAQPVDHVARKSDAWNLDKPSVTHVPAQPAAPAKPAGPTRAELKAAAAAQRKADLAEQKAAARRTQIARQALKDSQAAAARAQAASEKQAKSEQAKAKAVLARMSNDRNTPSSAEVQAAREVLSQVDTFSGGRIRGDRDSGGYSESGMGQQGGRGHPGMR
jgi:hypothetical protein